MRLVALRSVALAVRCCPIARHGGQRWVHSHRDLVVELKAHWVRRLEAVVDGLTTDVAIGTGAPHESPGPVANTSGPSVSFLPHLFFLSNLHSSHTPLLVALTPHTGQV